MDNNDTTSNKTLGGINKPKFQPKIPTKKPLNNSTNQTSDNDNTTSSNTTNSNNKSYKDGSKGFNNNNQSSNRPNRGPAARGPGNPMVHSGRGKVITPVVMGTAFFRGNQNTSTNRVTSNNYDSIVVKSEPNSTNKSTIKPVAIKKERMYGVENIEEKVEDIYPSYKEQSSDDEEDNDESQSTLPNYEIWPPTNYSPLDPLELPIGPRTSKARNARHSKSLLANSKDVDAITEEETTDMLIVQLPSDIKVDNKLSNHSKPNDVEVATDEDKKIKDNNTLRGKIGKMQLYSSGRVVMIDTSGRRYEVTGGIACSFAQYAASIDTDNNNGNIHMLGSITRKFVIVPEYEIGSEKRDNKNHININTFTNDNVDDTMFIDDDI